MQNYHLKGKSEMEKKVLMNPKTEYDNNFKINLYTSLIFFFF